MNDFYLKFNKELKEFKEIKLPSEYKVPPPMVNGQRTDILTDLLLTITSINRRMPPTFISSDLVGMENIKESDYANVEEFTTYDIKESNGVIFKKNDVENLIPNFIGSKEQTESLIKLWSEAKINGFSTNSKISARGDIIHIEHPVMEYKPKTILNVSQLQNISMTKNIAQMGMSRKEFGFIAENSNLKNYPITKELTYFNLCARNNQWIEVNNLQKLPLNFNYQEELPFLTKEAIKITEQIKNLIQNQNYNHQIKR